MRRPEIFVVLAALAAMAASVVVYSALKRRDAEVKQAMVRTVHIVVASHNLPLGSKIDASSVKLVRWSSDAIPQGAFTNTHQLIGSYVRNQIIANEPIVQSMLFTGQRAGGVLPLLIPAGMRAISVPVDQVSDIAGFVLPGAHVDVLVAMPSGSGISQPVSKVVLQDVEVLAVAQQVEKQKDAPKLVKVVTLLVTPIEAERLALASREGTLRLAMRNYNDNKIVPINGVDVKQLLGVYGTAPKMPVMPAQAGHRAARVRRLHKFNVEIMRNGTKSESVSFVQAAAQPWSPKPARKHAALSTDGHRNYALSAHTGAQKLASSYVTGSGSGASGNTNTASAAYVPTPKTIDVR